MVHLTVLRVIHALMASMLVLGRATLGWEVAHRAVIDGGSRFGLRVPLMRRMVLRGDRSGSQSRAGKQSRAHQESVPSGKGRTVTTCIMPACM